jgi:predicted nuclease of predicted toxin-antitoxin system
MRLLFDENISPRLVEALAAEFPQSAHVERVGLQGADDRSIWSHARAEGLTIVSKDTDFRDRSARDGAPPKIVWLDVGNAGTGVIASPTYS